MRSVGVYSTYLPHRLPMNPHRLGIAALGLALASWAQLSLIPLAHQNPIDPGSLGASLLGLGALVAAGILHKTHPGGCFAAAGGGFPLALGLCALVQGQREVPRFDAPSRVIAALTLTAYVLTLLSWWNARADSLTATLSPLEDRVLPTSPGPVLRHAAFAALAAAALFVSVIAPAVLSSREALSLEDRLGGEDLLRGRSALVAAAGVMIAIAATLGGGSSLLRAGPSRPRTVSRAGVYLLWAAAAFVMRYWLDHAR